MNTVEPWRIIAEPISLASHNSDLCSPSGKDGSGTLSGRLCFACSAAVLGRVTDIMISTFLTQIARKRDSRIKVVRFADLRGLPEKPLGIVWRGSGGFIIELDADRLKCVYKILFTLFHEIGHIRLNHLYKGRLFRARDSDQEREADGWAFSALGMTEICQRCINTSSEICLRGEDGKQNLH